MRLAPFLKTNNYKSILNFKHFKKNGLTITEYLKKAKALADEIDGKYDIITANIVADVLIAMKEHFLRYIKDGGFLIVSGIIEERMEEVLSAIEACGFTRLDVNVKEGWAAALFTK